MASTQLEAPAPSPDSPVSAVVPSAVAVVAAAFGAFVFGSAARMEVEECMGISSWLPYVLIHDTNGGWKSCASLTICCVSCCCRGCEGCLQCPSIGLNVDNEKPSTCLNSVLQELTSGASQLKREELVAAFFNKFEVLFQLFSNQGFQALEKLYYSIWLHSGQKVVIQEKVDVQLLENVVTIQGLTSSGYLLAVDDDNEMYELHPDGNSFDFFKGLIRRKLH